MIFRSLALTDFGTYAGTHRLDLSPAPDRPIVLIGGANGAGKTTILEALLLCLHGRRALGAAVRQTDYEAHVASRIHTPPEGGGDTGSASLSLVFEHSEGGHSSEYVVERGWKRGAKGKVEERLELSRDGQLVDELPESAWQDFLDGLVPPGIADLFLFDGERIQELADDVNGQQLKDAVRRLLGLDVVEQLRIDLRRYVSRESKGEAPELVDAHQKASAALDEAGNAVARLRDDRAELKGRIDQLKERNEHVRAGLAQQGGMLAEQRGELERQKISATEHSAGLKTEVRELVAGLLPFAICRETATAVRDRLSAEQAADEVEIVQSRIADQRAKLDRALASRRGEHPASEVVAKLLVGESAPTGVRVHDLTPSERVLLGDQLRRVLDDVPGRAAKLARQLNRAEEARKRASDQLDKVPPDDDLAPWILESQDLERELGGLEEKLDRLDEEIKQAKHQEKVATRDERRAGDLVLRSGKAAERVKRAIATIGVLERFEEKTQTAKLGAVELETARFFNRLSRKGELLSKVQIDPDSFKVSLTRWDGSELPKERLSAGEKQLFAISVLWAFSKVADRELPIVIDTPLARLDREHRDQLLREYFPHVSHQVVVLSTDTEVDAAAAHTVGPAVARSYHLEHDPKLCRTHIEDGYFHPLDRTADAR